MISHSLYSGLNSMNYESSLILRFTSLDQQFCMYDIINQSSDTLSSLIQKITFEVPFLLSLKSPLSLSQSIEIKKRCGDFT